MGASPASRTQPSFSPNSRFVSFLTPTSRKHSEWWRWWCRQRNEKSFRNKSLIGLFLSYTFLSLPLLLSLSLHLFFSLFVLIWLASEAVHGRLDDLFDIRRNLLLESESSRWRLRLSRVLGWSTFDGRWSRTDWIRINAMVWHCEQLYLPACIAWLPICLGCHREGSKDVDRTHLWATHIIHTTNDNHDKLNTMNDTYTWDRNECNAEKKREKKTDARNCLPQIEKTQCEQNKILLTNNECCFFHIFRAISDCIGAFILPSISIFCIAFHEWHFWFTA